MDMSELMHRSGFDYWNVKHHAQIILLRCMLTEILICAASFCLYH